MWNPPVIDERLQTRRSVLSETAELVADLVVGGQRTICFLRSRRGIELIQRFVRMRLEDLGRRDLAERIAPYRAGYTPQQRREIESRLAAGELLAVIATDALELGIDIGELDAAVCATFPGRSRACARCGGAPAGAPRASRSTSPVRTPGPVLLPHPASSWSARSRRRSSTTRTSASRRRTRSRRPSRSPSRPRTTRSSGRAGASARTRWSAPASCAAGATAATCRGVPASRPGTSPCARPRRIGRRRRPGLGGAAGLRRGGAGVHDDPSRRGLICTWAAPTRFASSTSTDGGRSSSPSTATGTRSRSATPRSSSRRSRRRARRGSWLPPAWSCTSGRSP